MKAIDHFKAMRANFRKPEVKATAIAARLQRLKRNRRLMPGTYLMPQSFWQAIAALQRTNQLSQEQHQHLTGPLRAFIDGALRVPGTMAGVVLSGNDRGPVKQLLLYTAPDLQRPLDFSAIELDWHPSRRAFA